MQEQLLGYEVSDWKGYLGFLSLVRGGSMMLQMKGSSRHSQQTRLSRIFVFNSLQALTRGDEASVLIDVAWPSVRPPATPPNWYPGAATYSSLTLDLPNEHRSRPLQTGHKIRESLTL